MRLQSIMTVGAPRDADGGGLTCPECRDDGRLSRLEVAGITGCAVAMSNTVTFVCPACAWTERYEL